MQESDLDVVAVTSSPKGFGKSSFIIQLARKYASIFNLTCNRCNHEWTFTGKACRPDAYGKIELIKEIWQPCPKCKSTDVRKPEVFNFKRYLGYDSEEVKDLIYDLPEYSPVLPDEGSKFMMGEDWMRVENKEMKKLFAIMRTKHLLLLTNIQKFQWTDRKIRDDMTSFWIRILKRGLTVLIQPDLGEAKDPWDMKHFDKILGKYFYFTPDDVLWERAEKLYNNHPGVIDVLTIPKVPDRIYDEYLKVRNEKAFARRRKEEMIDQRDVGKIVAWNLKNRWQETVGAVKASRFGQPTYKILERFMFSDPKSGDLLVRYTTIRNWINDIQRFLRR